MKLKLLHCKLLLLLLLGLIPSVNAQWQNGLWTEKQAYNWYFGVNAGLNFETSPVTSLSDGQTGPVTAYTFNDELGEFDLDDPRIEIPGTSSISDSEGNLLFYTNGLEVWNANHETMQNGTDLINSSFQQQSTLIVPIPGNSQKYYIFSVKQQSHTAVINPLLPAVDPFDDPLVVFSEVDMNLDNGLGAVTENKNVIITSESFYGDITATHHADGNQIWILFASSGVNTQFKTYLVSEEGLNMTPVISDFGFSATPGQILGTGQMKFSPDGTKIVKSVPSALNQKVEIFEFDKETGQVTNLIATLNQQDFVGDGEILGATGLEFSPNSKLLYTAGQLSGKLKQFNLEAGDETAIKASGIVISEPVSPPQYNSFLQVAPDGKIYVTYAPNWTGTGPEHNKLNIINYPNNIGINSGFQTDAIDLVDGISLKYLPNLLQSYFASGILHEGDCEGEATTFSTLRIPGIEAIAWDFGDPDSGADNASSDLEPSHIFSGPGTYTVTAVITSNGAQQSATTEVVVQPGPDAVIPAIENTSLCDEGSGSATFNLTANNQEILNGQDAALFTVTHYASEADVLAGTPIDTPDAFTTQGQTVYTQIVNTDTGCATLISYTLTVYPNPQAAAPDTLTPCGNQEGVAIINLTDNDSTILAGQDPSQFTVAYFSDAAQAESGTDPVDTPDAYDTAGETLYARVTDSATGCYSIVSFEVVIAEGDFIPGTISLTGCSPFDLTQGVEAFDPGLDYSYYTSEPDALSGSDAIATPQEYPLPAGTGFVYVRAENTEGCFDVAELVLETGDCTLPKGISPNNDGMNDSFDLTFLTGDGNGSLQVFNRYGVKVYEQGRYTNQWQGQDNSGNDLPTGTYYYVLQLQESHPDFGRNISRWVYIQREN